MTLTLAEAERLWANKHAELLKEFGGNLASQAERHEEQLVEAFDTMKLVRH